MSRVRIEGQWFLYQIHVMSCAFVIILVTEYINITVLLNKFYYGCVYFHV